jgi:hypothetical protein
MSPEDQRLQGALATLEYNRAVFRARFLPDKDGETKGGENTFPRSTTFRWLLAAVTNRQLVSAGLQALLSKYPFGRALAAWAMSRSSR